MEARSVSRRTEWVVSALAHHYGFDQGAPNEIVVLSLGVDQYIQEIFNNLDCAGAGVVSADQFRALCDVLAVGSPPSPDDLPTSLDFKQFHARLCEHVLATFGVRDFRPSSARVADDDEEYVTTSIKLNQATSLRGGGGGERPLAATACITCSMCVRELVNSLLLNKCKMSFAGAMRRGGGGAALTAEQGDCAAKIELIWRAIVDSYETLQQRVVAQEEEVEGLRELVEDLRAALQSGDARCLAFQVELRRTRQLQRQRQRDPCRRCVCDGGAPAPTIHRSVKTIEIRNGRVHSPDDDDHHQVAPPLRGDDQQAAPPTLAERYRHYSPRCMERLVREMARVRGNRDVQLQEALYVTEDLQYEARKRRRAIERLQREADELVALQSRTRDGLREARVYVGDGLERVLELESEARELPLLREKVRQLTKKATSPQERNQCSSSNGRSSPMGQCCSPKCPSPDILDHRAVEGQSGSEDDISTGRDDVTIPDDVITPADITKIQAEVTSLKRQLADCHFKAEEVNASMREELANKQFECDEVLVELQQSENERARLTIIEHGLRDALHLLNGLKSNLVSRRTLGKMVMDALDRSETMTSADEAVQVFVTSLQTIAAGSALLHSSASEDSSPNTTPKRRIPVIREDIISS
ncbi:PREDICTED: EF-hand and coiled-coil domain-containing protein 1-like [Priapulus caudatus]|uniref:EF-hand and coiled-coil domain-containing protein 1-like n=1 Tax=Priapulus caudatus TaxID=37621 RepID=A0ABM1EF39_PRICU|nr:PREDICTED: EF-hand and coiled-coil domain-containing protein 1-like [Priapulus caudatus]